MKSYLISLPERLVRSVLGVGAGAVHEVSELALPDGVRDSQLYQNLVASTLRFLIEQVGGVEGVYRPDTALSDDFVTRRTAGNAIEMLGIVAFRASPVWVLAALADLCGAGRHLIPEIADALKEKNLLDRDVAFSTVDQILDGLERTAARLAQTVNAPPLDVAGLRREWAALREDVGVLPEVSLPSIASITDLWAGLKAESARQHCSIFETSSVMAISAVRHTPEQVRWLSHSALAGATRTGQLVGGALLTHYRDTLGEIQEIGYLAYATRQCRPYARAAAGQFSPLRLTLTQKLLERLRWRRSP